MNKIIIAVFGMILFTLGFCSGSYWQRYDDKSQAIAEVELDQLTVKAQDIVDIWLAEKRKELR